MTELEETERDIAFRKECRMLEETAANVMLCQHKVQQVLQVLDLRGLSDRVKLSYPKKYHPILEVIDVMVGAYLLISEKAGGTKR